MPCRKILGDQLNGWDRARKRWLEDRNLEIIWLWFDYRFHSVLFDLGENRESRYQIVRIARRYGQIRGAVSHNPVL